MPWIRTVDESEADGRLAELYARMVDPEHGRVDEILRVHSLDPEGLEAHWRLYRSAMRPTPGVRRAEREMIALAVSRANDCHY